MDDETEPWYADNPDWGGWAIGCFIPLLLSGFMLRNDWVVWDRIDTLMFFVGLNVVGVLCGVQAYLHWRSEQ